MTLVYYPLKFDWMKVGRISDTGIGFHATGIRGKAETSPFCTRYINKMSFGKNIFQILNQYGMVLYLG